MKWLDMETRLFPIGSCFALNFARWIGCHGVMVCKPEIGMHYNPLIIRDELNALANCVQREFPYWHTVENGFDNFISKLRHPFIAKSVDDHVINMQTVTQNGEAAFRSATAFLITYGLSDLTEEKATVGWQTLNRIPPKGVSSIVRSRLMSPIEVADVTSEIVANIHRIKPHCQIVFSVSPIPLKATYSGNDLDVANRVSKLNLLEGLRIFMQRDNTQRNLVHYFPAYEIFFDESHGLNPWQADGRHPTSQIIAYICKRFAAQFRVNEGDFSRDVEFSVPTVAA